MKNADYIANGGQTYMPFKENIYVKTVDYTPLEKPKKLMEELVLNKEAIKKGLIIKSQEQHFVPNVTSEMLDWFWANMEKCYYLWAPGSHKRFNWVKEPWQVGFINSVHMISESVGENLPVFGGNGIEIHRLGLEYFPFTKALEHVIVEGTFNDLGEFVDSTIHMWDDTEGGCRHITASVVNTKVTEPPRFVKEMLEENPDVKIVPPSDTNHAEYEASMWPRFLPTLYGLWKDHPDKTQSVQCDLSVRTREDGTLEYIHENGPVKII